jgi:hypothetical protein
MENNKSSYIKTDENKFINENTIIWVKKSDCIEIGAIPKGSSFIDTYIMCKINHTDNYNKVNNSIEDNK